MKDLDTVIEREVRDALCTHHEIHATELHVHVAAGVVRLTGSFRSLTESLAAQQAVFGVGGVVDVVNASSVQVPGGVPKSDVDIARAVRHALVWNTLIPDDVISSNVADGVVRLHGTVDDPVEREEAERSVCHLAGVRRVHNLIDIQPREAVIRGVKHAIETALDRQAEAEAERIRVEAREGLVTLSGVVRCAAERRAAVHAAANSLGVRDVEDHLRVDGGV
jgi:osmotically-inducible protein OsmY